MDVVLGQVVYSKAGRDAGKAFVITGLIDSNYVYISDGDLRRSENPKKKKLKHLDITSTVVESVAQKIAAEGKITNAEVRRALIDVKESDKISD